MLKILCLSLVLISFPLLAQEAPVVPDYGKLLLIENRPFKPYFEAGLGGGIALDNTTEDVYSISAMGNYVFTPLFSIGAEAMYNKTEDKPYLAKIEKAGNVKVSNYTPDYFFQMTLRLNLIKGHLNLVNRWNSPFEFAAILGSGVGYNDEQTKSSSLVSWGGELQIPFKNEYKAVAGVRHFKSYAFQNQELSFTSLLIDFRKVF